MHTRIFYSYRMISSRKTTLVQQPRNTRPIAKGTVSKPMLIVTQSWLLEIEQINKKVMLSQIERTKNTWHKNARACTSWRSSSSPWCTALGLSALRFPNSFAIRGSSYRWSLMTKARLRRDVATKEAVLLSESWTLHNPLNPQH